MRHTSAPPFSNPPSTANRRRFILSGIGTTFASLLTAPGAEGGPTSENTRDLKKIASCAPGPWGRLSYYYFFLEAPAHVVEKFPLPNTTPRWIFDLADYEVIAAQLKQAGVDASQVDQLLQSRRMARDDRRVYVFPTAGMVENLSPETRSTLYAILARNPANTFYHSPVFFLTDSVEEWAKDSELPQAVVQRISRLAYKSGNALVFSDIPLLLGYASSIAEARFIMQKLTRVRTLLARLDLGPEDSIPDLLNYWSTGLGLRRKELEPLMRAVVRTEGVVHLDILHLLPPLPRKLLYTFPDLTFAVEGRMPDCHWTSLNFFNMRPQSYLLDSRLATSLVKQDFDKVEPPYRYGDVLMFISPDERAVHSATYLAGDIVFSKNGANMLTPWLLMRLPDLEKLYDVAPENTRIVAFRHKASAESLTKH